MQSRYVIITPAYNEENSIGATIISVVRQTVLPSRWIIIDDGSTDGTADIIKGFQEQYGFIEYQKRIRVQGQSYYGSNVYAIVEGYEKVKDSGCQFLAILDADIELCRNYYEEIFKRFEMNPELGVASGTYLENVDGFFKEAVIDRHSTPKAIQVFRTCCYEQIGGFIPCRNGGEDSCAEIMARMFGWQTWSFPEIRTIHQKPVGTGDGRSILSGRFRLGLTDYCLSTHPLFMLAKCLRRSFVEKPYLASGLCRLAGYIKGYITSEPRDIPDLAAEYVRKEQMERLLAKIGIGGRSWMPVIAVEEK